MSIWLAICQDASSQRLCRCHSFFLRRSVGQNTGQVCHFSDPAPVFFSLKFDLKLRLAHSHAYLRGFLSVLGQNLMDQRLITDVALFSLFP